MDAIVDAALYEKIPEGTDLDMAVELAYDGEAYYVTNILGEEPSMGILANSITGNDSLNVYGDEITAEADGALRLSGAEIHLQASTEFINVFAPLTIQLVTNPGGYVELGIGGPRIITGSGSPVALGNVSAPLGSSRLDLPPHRRRRDGKHLL